MAINKKRKLWLMTNCCITYASQKQQSDFADRFVSKLNEEEIDFCLQFLKGDYKDSKELMKG